MPARFIEQHRERIHEIAARYGARNVRIFGSLARGEGEKSSDVDFLVSLEEGRTLLDLVSLKQDLEAALGRPVDVITDRSLSSLLRQRVLDEAVAL